MDSLPPTPGDRREWRLSVALFAVLLVMHGAILSVGWGHGNLPGQEFRQAQTALSALFIQRDGDFSLAYPTPVLGQPWSLPMEFPLYQWLVVGVSNATGLPLIQAGRAVTAACFYLALAALWPLLGRLGLAPARRLVVMGLVLSCPLYLFYSRAFLIESLVLALSLWFLVAFTRFIARPGWGGFAVVASLGVLAGLVKVTTFIVFLIPAGLWTWAAMRAAGREGGLGAMARRGFWALGSITAPVLATALWTRFADSVKEQNVSARFLLSGNLTDFNFGTAENRFSAETLQHHWNNLSHNLAGPLLLATALLLALTVSRRWWRPMLLCLGVYLASLAMFPTLYAWHDYYASTNAVLLLTAAGLAVAGSFDLRVRWLPWVLLAVLHASQLLTYRATYFELQRAPSPGGSDMTRAVRAMTNHDEVIVVAGYDWDSSIPFYSQRRALMIRSGMESDWTYLHEAFQAQAGLPVTVFVVKGRHRDNATLRELLGQYFDLDPRPLFRWKDATVYGRKDRRATMVDAVRRLKDLRDVDLDETTAGETWSARNQEVLTADVLEMDQSMLALFEPRPWKFFSQYGAHLAEEAGRPVMFAHPDTRLWFRVPPGRHHVEVEFCVQAGAYDSAVAERTDGVEFFIEQTGGDGPRRLAAKFLDPANREEDRGFHRLTVTVEGGADTVILIATGPGPTGAYHRDWAAFAGIRIRPVR